MGQADNFFGFVFLLAYEKKRRGIKEQLIKNYSIKIINEDYRNVREKEIVKM